MHLTGKYKVNVDKLVAIILSNQSPDILPSRTLPRSESPRVQSISREGGSHTDVSSTTNHLPRPDRGTRVERDSSMESKLSRNDECRIPMTFKTQDIKPTSRNVLAEQTNTVRKDTCRVQPTNNTQAAKSSSEDPFGIQVS